MNTRAYKLCMEAGIEPTCGALGLVGFIDEAERIIKKVVSFIK